MGLLVPPPIEGLGAQLTQLLGCYRWGVPTYDPPSVGPECCRWEKGVLPYVSPHIPSSKGALGAEWGFPQPNACGGCCRCESGSPTPFPILQGGDKGIPSHVPPPNVLGYCHCTALCPTPVPPHIPHPGLLGCCR